MKAKIIIKWGCGIAAVLFAAVLLLIGSFEYVTRLKITDIDSSISNDGQYELLYQSVGEPDWPFGASHARLVLKHNGKTVTNYKFDVANDGGILHADSWSVSWEENCVKVIISGEEQPDALYTLSFDGTIQQESLAAREPGLKETDSAGKLFDEPTTDFSDIVAENEKGESVFAISVEDFIDCYNSVYRQTHETGYLNSTNSENWYCYTELSPRFGYEAVRYEFSADRTVWPMPTISFYAPDNDEIYEIRMTFDDHGYQERLFELFKELCFCMEKTMMPELSETESAALFEKLYAQSDMNFFGDHSAYGDPERPQLNAMYRCDNIGMYCFYGSGNIEICFIPLTAAAINMLKSGNIIFLDVCSAGNPPPPDYECGIGAPVNGVSDK